MTYQKNKLWTLTGRKWPSALLVFTMMVSFAGSHYAAIDGQCAKLVRENSKAYWLEPEGSIDPDKAVLFPRQLRPFRFEHALAKQAEMTTTEVVGLVRNFELDPQTTWIGDGSIGLILDLRTGVYEIDASINLVAAYKWGMENITPGHLSVNEIIEIRKRVLEVLILKHGELQVRSDQVEFKDETDVADIAGANYCLINTCLYLIIPPHYE